LALIDLEGDLPIARPFAQYLSRVPNLDIFPLKCPQSDIL
jgi:hypothetical protein